jgi:hypothetical protein
MSDISLQTSRRALLRWGAVGAAALTVTPSELIAETAAYPPDVGRKFGADGRVLPFAGNTVICHLPQQGENSGAFDAMLDIYRDVPTHRFARKIALLPPSSYHMTVFGGANDQPRTRSSWPADLPLDMPIADCNRVLTERLKQSDLRVALPIRMRIVPAQSPENGKALIFLLQPADEGERAKLRRLRDQLGDVFKIHAPNAAEYRFHISLGYPIAWFTAQEMRELQITWARWVNSIDAKSPEIQLGAPEYCIFTDMYAFKRELFLS